MVYSVFNDPQEIRGTLTTKQPTPAAIEGIADGDWPAYGRTQSGLRYSPLSQINETNVKDLKVAWEYHTGETKTDNDSGETTNQVTPIKVGNNVYLCTTHQRLVSLDPTTGKLYKCFLALEGNDKLKVRGYIGVSLFGRTQIWNRVK